MAKKEKLQLDKLLEQALVKEEDKPYEVPSNWVWTRLENLVSVLGDGLHGTPIYSELGDYYFINGNNLNNGFIEFKDNTKKVHFKEFSKYKKELNDRTIFVSINGTLGNVAFYNNEKIILGKSACYFNIFENICKEYIIYLIKSEYFINYANTVATGSTIKNLSLKSMRECVIPLPPLPEQQRIVDSIKSLFDKLDRAKELVQKALDSFENRKSAILHKAFTGELTTKWREENGISFDSWKEFKIKDLAISLNQGWSPKCEGFPSVDYEKWGVIKTTAIQHMEFIEQENKQLPSSLVPREKHELKEGDVLITRAGPRIRVGVCCLVKQVRPRLLLCDKAYRFRAKEKLVIPEYIVFVLNTSDILDTINVMKTGISDSGVNLTLDGFLAIKLNIPSIVEQKEIVNILDNLLKNEQKAKELCDVIDNIDLMKKSILARAFRGELSTNNPNEESALELLKEIFRER